VVGLHGRLGTRARVARLKPSLCRLAGDGGQFAAGAAMLLQPSLQPSLLPSLLPSELPSLQMVAQVVAQVGAAMLA
jgi:hypothetical protein